jgi:hypothetical protein
MLQIHTERNVSVLKRFIVDKSNVVVKVVYVALSVAKINSSN